MQATPPITAFLPIVVAFFLLVFALITFAPHRSLRASWTGRFGLVLGAASAIYLSVYWFHTVSDPSASRVISLNAWLGSGATLASILFCFFGRTVVCYTGAFLLAGVGYLWMTWINDVCCHP